ncbi:MAG: DNA repair protein RadA [Candidatus Saccharimonadales bacterium]
MAKSHKYVCQQCATSYPKWSGRCENCGSWNSLVESTVTADGKSVVARSQGAKLQSTEFKDVSIDSIQNRVDTGFGEINDILGGGLMPGSVILVSGEPGIGKSTLLLQLAAFVASERNVLYVTGEESIGQVKLRGDRLGVGAKKLQLASSTSADDIAATIRDSSQALAIIDSIQTMMMADIASAPGTVSQITNATNLLIRAAKESHTTIILVGHVTKEGSIAGPKVMEHLVDVVVQFEGDRYGGLKIVRSIKNRYGSTSEVAILEMTEKGLQPVDNPSAGLLSERSQSDGSIVLATMEGNRPLLVEIQALVTQSHFGYPKRTSSGFDLNRLQLLIAVMEKRTKLQLGDKDIFVNVVGGLKLQDPAADLAVCMAIASAASGRAMDIDAVVYGEVGLGGEIRSAHAAAKRNIEAKKLGFSYVVAPTMKTHDNYVKETKTLVDALRGYLVNTKG